MTEVNDAQTRLQLLFTDPGLLNETAQVQSRALLSEISDEGRAVNWTYVGPRVVRNLAFGTIALRDLALTSAAETDGWTNVGRRIGAIWEKMAFLGESTDQATGLLNAALCYELAGYQASATAIARRLAQLKEYASASPVLDWGRIFIERKFLQLREVTGPLLEEPTTLEPDLATLAEMIGVGTAARGFGGAARFFLSGDFTLIESAQQDFADAKRVWSDLGVVETANLMAACEALMPAIRERSTWQGLLSALPGNPRWHRYLRLLARGPGEDVYRSRSVSEIWPSQRAALTAGLLSDLENKVVRMPTSAGKTRIAELAIAHSLISSPGTRCVYVAPYRALAAELQRSLSPVLSDLGYRVSSVVGAYDSDELEELLFQQTDVLVTTPEKLDLIRRSDSDFLDTVRLFVLDEAHILDDYTRGAKFEFTMTRLKDRLPDARFLVLSAVVPDQTLIDVAKWLNASPSQDIARSDWRPSVQRYARFEWTGKIGTIRYVQESDVPGLDAFVPGVIEERTFEFRNPATNRINRPRFPSRTLKSQTAAELAYKFAELGSVLVFCPQPDRVESVAKALHERISLARRVGEPVPNYFEPPTDTRSVLLAREWLGERAITTWLEAGIGVHYGPLPDVLRTALEVDFRSRRLRVLIATNTLAQGVNLPVRTVIIHSTRRYNQQTESMERIPARDYWNVAGRAGRAGEETEGLVIQIATTPQDRVDFGYYQDRRDNVEPVRSAIAQRLAELAAGRLSQEALEADFDSDVLALLVEEASEPEQGVFEEVVQGSLARVQLADRPLDVLKMGQVLSATADRIAEQVTEPALLPIYSSTGLSTTSCEALRVFVDERRDELLPLLIDGEDVANTILPLILPPLFELDEIHPQVDIEISPEQLLSRWLRGVPIPSLTRDLGNGDVTPEGLGKFIDDAFRYRLPWGLAAFLRIASTRLAIDRTQFPAAVKYLPSMVKFGVDDPTACWAMILGVPFREAALRLAASFTRETKGEGFEEFLEWLGTLSTERLHYDFGLRGVVHEDVSRALFAASRNTFLREFTTLDAFLPRVEPVRGIRYEERALVAERAEPGTHLKLTRDYDNPVDRNAIALFLEDAQLGFVPREIAQVLAPEIDAGLPIEAVVDTVTREPIPRVLVTLSLGPQS